MECLQCGMVIGLITEWRIHGSGMLTVLWNGSMKRNPPAAADVGCQGPVVLAVYIAWLKWSLIWKSLTLLKCGTVRISKKGTGIGGR